VKVTGRDGTPVYAEGILDETWMYERGFWSCTLNGKATVPLSSIFEQLEIYLADKIHTIDRHESLVRDGCIAIHQETRAFEGPNVSFRLGVEAFRTIGMVRLVTTY